MIKNITIGEAKYCYNENGVVWYEKPDPLFLGYNEVIFVFDPAINKKIHEASL